jgi:hypothetical protein
VRIALRVELAECVADRLAAVLLRQQDELPLEEPRGDLGRPPGPVPVLAEDRLGELEQGGLVGGGRFADVHGASLAPVSR